MRQREGDNLQLTPQRAFVIQFRADTDVTSGHLVGRVEHVVSGRSVRFATLDALLAFVTGVLQDVNQAPVGKRV